MGVGHLCQMTLARHYAWTQDLPVAVALRFKAESGLLLFNQETLELYQSFNGLNHGVD